MSGGGGDGNDGFSGGVEGDSGLMAHGASRWDAGWWGVVFPGRPPRGGFAPWAGMGRPVRTKRRAGGGGETRRKLLLLRISLNRGRSVLRRGP